MLGLDGNKESFVFNANMLIIILVQSWITSHRNNLWLNQIINR